MKKIAIANSKGGVAKSTSTVALAVAAANKGFKVLLIDLDPQGSCTYLSNKSNNSEDNAAKMFQDEPVHPSELAVKTDYGYDIVVAAPSLLEASDWLHKTSMGEQRLKLLFQRDVNLDNYDYIFIDTPGDKSRLVYSVLYSVDSVLVPVRPSAVTTNELVDFIEILLSISKMRESLGQTALVFDSVCFTLIEEYGGNPTNAAKENMKEVRDGLAEMMHVAGTTIPTSTAVEKAAIKQSPVLALFPEEKVSKRYFELFDEVYGEKRG